jgi:hypothetical protein
MNFKKYFASAIGIDQDHRIPDRLKFTGYLGLGDKKLCNMELEVYEKTCDAFLWGVGSIMGGVGNKIKTYKF